MSHSNFISQINRFPLSRNWPTAEPAQSDEAKWQRLLDGVAENSPYLSRLLEKHPDTVAKLLEHGPTKALQDIYLPKSIAATISTTEFETMLREAKTKFHLCLALIDLSGVWDTQQITQALSDFADQMVANCTRFVWKNAPEPVRQQAGSSGFFVVAFGKLGGHELNYSSDVDLAFFYETQKTGLPAKDLIRIS
ncbi:Glutamate-ammonia-ligase adenylyltransferase, partial [hydrothermal vent metagenome]